MWSFVIASTYQDPVTYGTCDGAHAVYVSSHSFNVCFHVCARCAVCVWKGMGLQLGLCYEPAVWNCITQAVCTWRSSLVVVGTPIPCKALTSLTLPLQVLNVRLRCIYDDCLSSIGYKNYRHCQGRGGCKRIVDLCGGTRARWRFEAVCKKKRGCAPFSSSQPSKIVSEDSQRIGKLWEGFSSCLR